MLIMIKQRGRKWKFPPNYFSLSTYRVINIPDSLSHSGATGSEIPDSTIIDDVIYRLRIPLTYFVVSRPLRYIALLIICLPLVV